MSNVTNMPPTGADQAQALSDLMDGESPVDAAAAACSLWFERGEARADWHAFHVIGDVMRSEELGCAAQDEDFLRRLHERLAREPVVITPTPAAVGDGHAGARRGGRALGAFGVAAALCLLAVAGFVLKDSGTQGVADKGEMARASVPAAGPVASAAEWVAVAPAAQAASETAQVANGATVRNAQLDRYLDAHKQFSGTSALGPSPGFLRSATYETPSR